MLDRTSSVPLAMQLAKELTLKIEQGEYPAYSLFPTEEKLTERYGVSRTTVRQALAQLAEQRGEQPYVIVCREGLMPLVESVAGSRRAGKAVRTATILGYIGAAVGVALAYYLTSIGNFALLTPIAMVVYQLLWLLPTLLLAGLVKHY